MPLQQDKGSNGGEQDVHNISADSGGSNPPSGKPHKQLGTSDFVELLGEDESYYIDKTGLVEVFLECNRSRVLVTAPCRFGKTINLVMLGHFFELQVQNFKNLSEEEFQEKVKETDNFKLFNNHGLNITKNDKLMKKHFGRYPVISISFKCEWVIKSYNDAINFCMSVLKDIFTEHKYLESSIESHDKDDYNKWLYDKWDLDKSGDRMVMLGGLLFLARYVCKYFNKKVMLLIDEYDSVITKAMLNVESPQEIKDIIEDCTSIMKNTIKENDKQNWVAYAFITGISHISGMGLSGSNVKAFQFLGNHSFTPYYGLLDTEGEQLLKVTYNFSDEEIKYSEKKFSGYCSKGNLKMYNMWSLLEYAGKRHENEDTCEWQDTGMIIGLKEALRFPAIKKMIETTLLKDVPIDIGCVKKHINVEEVLALLRIIRNFDPQNIKFPQYNLFFAFILEQGYLSYAGSSGKLLRIPNEQIKEVIEGKVKSFDIEVFGVGQNLTQRCRQFFLDVLEKVCHPDTFICFHKDLEQYLQLYSTTWIKKCEENIRNTMSILTSDLDCSIEHQTSFKDATGTQRFLDFMLVKGDFVLLGEFKYKESSKAAMDAIKERHYCDVFVARDVITDPVKHYVLLGVNMNENGKVFIGYLQDSQNFDAVTYLPEL